MLWPLAVAGCECGHDSMKEYAPEILRLLNSLQEIFSMDHTARVRELLQELWQRQSTTVVTSPLSFILEGSSNLSLERVARERQLIVPLL
jgi:hypothetical protein